MIVVQIHSGLGNQLFMYAAARALAQKHDTALYLDVDTDCRQGVNNGAYVGHSFQLDRFNIRARRLESLKPGGAGGPSSLGAFAAIKSRLRDITLLRKAVRLLRYRGVDLTALAMKASGHEKRMFREARGDWKYKPEFFDLPDDVILRGCFFSYRYFDWMKETIREELRLKAELSPQSRAVEQQILASNAVSLHLRRRDIITDPEYRSWYEGVVTETYYRNAIAYFRERLVEPHFFVFSDDMAWVKRYFRIPGAVTHVDHNGPETGYEDLHLMSKCRHNVTTGFSSFSWWAAYLNANPEKIVLRTRRMNALDQLNHPEDFFPTDWIAVES